MKQIAFEFHNYETGHCYVDYAPKHFEIDGVWTKLDEARGYTRIPLYMAETKKEKLLVHIDDEESVVSKWIREDKEAEKRKTAEEFADKLYESKIIHDYRDGKIDFRYIRTWILNNFPSQSLPEISERFKMPTDKEITEIALLFNDGKIQKTKLRDMIAMSLFVLDRLYEHGDISKKASKEID